MPLKRRGPAAGPTSRAGSSLARFTERSLLQHEHLVGFGFRCWLAGYQTNDVNCWEVCWNHYASVLGPSSAKRTIAELSCWVRAVDRAAARKVEVFPARCRGFCRDECLAISIIAAGQDDASCPAMRACAFALLESSAIEETVETGNCFASVLRSEGIVLQSASIINAAAWLEGSREAGTNSSSKQH